MTSIFTGAVRVPSLLTSSIDPTNELVWALLPGEAGLVARIVQLA
ncbi:MAG: hypothetical protein SFX73_30205 [Kofleriaceae bacterium]|nr:hypothetical protein [Kofleriaceae bacterium]